MTSSQPVVTPNALNFTPDNKRVYAYSGIVSVNGTETDLINSETGTYYCIMKVAFGSGVIVDDTDDFTYRIRFNGEIIWQHTQDHSDAQYTWPSTLHIIIPPYTRVRLTAENTTDNTSHNQIVTMTGRVYGMTETDYQ